MISLYKRTVRALKVLSRVKIYSLDIFVYNFIRTVVDSISSE